MKRHSRTLTSRSSRPDDGPYRDPRPKAFAVISLLREGGTVGETDIADVAASTEMRVTLFTELQKFDKLALIPEKYNSQGALAESDMVQWLVYPTELGQIPDEIELMKVITRREKDGPADWYVYRYRALAPHPIAKDGRMAGVAGPYPHNGPLQPDGGGTFSMFEKWEGTTPEQHLDKISGVVDDAAKKQEEEKPS